MQRAPPQPESRSSSNEGQRQNNNQGGWQNGSRLHLRGHFPRNAMYLSAVSLPTEVVEGHGEIKQYPIICYASVNIKTTLFMPISHAIELCIIHIAILLFLGSPAPQLSNTLSNSRLIAARRMLNKASQLMDRLDDPTVPLHPNQPENNSSEPSTQAPSGGDTEQEK